LFLVGYAAVRHAPPRNSVITVEVAPKSAKITIDGKKAGVGNNKVFAGKHTVKISKEGFSQQAQTITTQAEQTVYLGTALSSNSPKTQNWYKENPDDQKLSEGISSHQSDYDSQTAVQSNTLLQQLPISIGGAFGTTTIGSGIPVQGSNQPAIYISAPTATDRQSALAWMRNNGYNPATMDIVFNGSVTSFEAQDGE